jgi:hypothetical protein
VTPRVIPWLTEEQFVAVVEQVRFVRFAARWAARKLELVTEAPQAVRRRELTHIASVLRRVSQ